MSSFVPTVQSPLFDYVLDEQQVEIELNQKLPYVRASAEFRFLVRVGANDPRIKINASHMRIRKVSVCGQEVRDYEYFDLMDRIVSKEGEERNVKDLQQCVGVPLSQFVDGTTCVCLPRHIDYPRFIYTSRCRAFFA